MIIVLNFEILYIFTKTYGMKFFTLLFIQFIFLMQFIKAQDSVLSKKDQYSFYMKKRNTNNTIGFITLSTGLALGAISLIEGLDDAFNINSSNSNHVRGTGIGIAGEIIALGSIPFLVIAHKYKKKAHLLMKSESIRFNNHPIYQSGYTALALRINL